MTNLTLNWVQRRDYLINNPLDLSYLIPLHRITEKQNSTISIINANENDEEILTNIERDSIMRISLKRLNGIEWLNDEIINAYVRLCTFKSNDIFLLNSHFLTILAGNEYLNYNFKNVIRWTKNIDVSKKRAIIIPVNVDGNHWCLIAVDVPNRIITCYDSLGNRNLEILGLINSYLKDLIKSSEWTSISIGKDSPQQTNNSDCGIFVCTTANILCEYYSFGNPEPFPIEQLKFSQRNIPRLRTQMKIDLLRKSLFPY